MIKISINALVENDTDFLKKGIQPIVHEIRRQDKDIQRI